MKLNKQAVYLTIELCLITVAAASWAHGLNSVTLSITALLILGALARMLAAKPVTIQPQPLLVEAVERRQAG